MKKLIFALAVCAVCGMAQAASLLWSSGGNAVDENGGLIGSSASDGKLVLALLGTTSNYGYDSAVAVQEGSWSVSSGKTTSSAVSMTYYGGGTIDGAGTGTIENGNVYAVMFQDANGDLHQLKDSSGNAIDSTYTIDHVPGATEQFQFTFASGNFAATGASYGGIPEPTSGLLLALGVCALALRRRRS